MKKQKKFIIFDLDGTLYSLRGGSYRKSLLRQCVFNNAQNYISVKLSKSKSDAQSIFNAIQEQYGEQISIGLEKEFNIDRYDYFNTVWDIPANDSIKKSQGLQRTLLTLKKEYNLALVSDAPRVWINNALEELRVKDIFQNNIFSGEGEQRKEFNNAFSGLVQALKLNPRNCIAVGDQEHTDIIPAKTLGMYTVFVYHTKHSSVADANIRHISELPMALKNVFKNQKKK